MQISEFERLPNGRYRWEVNAKRYCEHVGRERIVPYVYETNEEGKGLWEAPHMSIRTIRDWEKTRSEASEAHKLLHAATWNQEEVRRRVKDNDEFDLSYFTKPEPFIQRFFDTYPYSDKYKSIGGHGPYWYWSRKAGARGDRDP